MALSKETAVVARDAAVTALDMQAGTKLWELPLAAPPVQWGMAVDNAGRVVVTLRDGRVVCIGDRN